MMRIAAGGVRSTRASVATRAAGAAMLAAIALVVPAAAAPQTPDPPKPIDAALARMAAYVQTFVTRFSNVTAEERYVQERTASHRTRVLLSDYLLVSLPGSKSLLEFRDTYEVDGKPVADRSKRLVELLQSETTENWVKRAGAVARGGARFNLEDIGSLNRTLVTLSLMQAPFQKRFVFTFGPLDTKVAPNARLIQFRETARPTLTGGRAVHGRVWIEDGTGIILKTELLIGDAKFPDQIFTTYKADPDLGVYVPAEMREWYSFGNFEVTGLATYGRFRRFGVTSQETFQQ
jgi:hypothetical protein